MFERAQLAQLADSFFDVATIIGAANQNELLLAKAAEHGDCVWFLCQGERLQERAVGVSYTFWICGAVSAHDRGVGMAGWPGVLAALQRPSERLYRAVSGSAGPERRGTRLNEHLPRTIRPQPVALSHRHTEPETVPAGHRWASVTSYRI